MGNEHRLLKYFSWIHLPTDSQVISKEFHTLAMKIVELPAKDGCMQTVALRKLLEAKDAVARMMLK